MAGSRQEGYRLEPGSRAASKSVAYRRHKRILEQLKAAGKLTTLDGLTWYSWKDTGISEHARKTSPLATRDQAGHGDFDMTLRYYEAEKVNSEYLNLDNHIIYCPATSTQLPISDQETEEK